MGKTEGYLDGFKVSPGSVGKDVDGYLDGAALGKLLGREVDGLEVGHDDGCFVGKLDG